MTEVERIVLKNLEEICHQRARLSTKETIRQKTVSCQNINESREDMHK